MVAMHEAVSSHKALHRWDEGIAVGHHALLIGREVRREPGKRNLHGSPLGIAMEGALPYRARSSAAFMPAKMD